MRASWSAAVYLGNTDQLEELLSPKLLGWNSGNHFWGNLIRRILSWFSSQAHRHGFSQVNWHTWGSYFEYFARWMVCAGWIVVGFWKVDPRTKDKSLSDAAPPPSFLHKALCCVQSRTHAIQPRLRFADTLKVILSLRSCQGSAHVMHSFWALDAHIPPGRRSRHLNKSKQRLLAPQDHGCMPHTY